METGDIVSFTIFCAVSAPLVFMLCAAGAAKLHVWLVDGALYRVGWYDKLTDINPGIFWLWSVIIHASFLSIMFNPVVLLIAGVIVSVAYLARFSIRLKTKFDAHVVDKKAHK